MNTNIKVIVFPDIHGRTFWKEALKKYPENDYPDIQIIFLGDYLDPYTSYDGISKADAYANFEEILDLKDKRVQLLIGNHDWHYFVNLDTCRMDMDRHKDIEHMFKENMNKFRVHKIIEINGTQFLFTHAGITQSYLDSVASLAENTYNTIAKKGIENYKDEDLKWIEEMSIINETYDFELFEKCLQNYDQPFYSAPLSMISRERGGRNPYGSLIWADVYEHVWDEDLKDYYQVFGHTITFPTGPKDYAISYNKHNWAMIDSSQAFIIDDKGEIKPLI